MPIPSGPATNNQDLVEQLKGPVFVDPLEKYKKYGKIDSFIAVAWHPHANEVWVVRRNPISLKDAEARVLTACNKAMGGNCSIAASGGGISVVVLYIDDILTDVTWDESYTNALRKAKEKNNCSNEDWNTKCKPKAYSNLEKIIDPKEIEFKGDTTESDFPTGKVTRR
ncbi:MAG: hypothetical protein LZF86_110301 [Nitrospira sp.]|nr:MAG: hypothetical protein LZF86_110301 [Nitrospira sp.]